MKGFDLTYSLTMSLATVLRQSWSRSGGRTRDDCNNLDKRGWPEQAVEVEVVPLDSENGKQLLRACGGGVKKKRDAEGIFISTEMI